MQRESGSTMQSLTLTHRSSRRYVTSPRHLPTVRWCESSRKALKGVRWRENAKCVHTLVSHRDERHSGITHFHCFTLCGCNVVHMSAVCMHDVAKVWFTGYFWKCSPQESTCEGSTCLTASTDSRHGLPHVQELTGLHPCSSKHTVLLS